MEALNIPVKLYVHYHLSTFSQNKFIVSVCDMSRHFPDQYVLLETHNINIAVNQPEPLDRTTVKSRQCDALRRAGIFFLARPDGHPKTTWGHFLNPIKYRGQEALVRDDEEPDFGAVFDGRKA